MGLRKIFNKVLSVTQEISLFTLVFCGFGVIVSAVGFGLYIPTKLLAVIVSSIGSCAGAGIIALTIPKLVGVRLAEDKEKIVQKELKIIQAEEQVKRVQELGLEKEKLLAEIERHKNMRVDVNAYRNILKLGLSQFDIDTYDFKQEVIEEKDRSHVLDPRRSVKREYVGVIRHKFKAMFGVDLSKLEFSELSSNVLQISGVTSEFQGLIPDLNENPRKLAEIRVRKYSENSSDFCLMDSYKIISCQGLKSSTKDGITDYEDFADRQEREFLQRFTQGLVFQGLQNHIIQMAEEFLRLVFQPMGKTIQFVDSIPSGGKGFLEYLEARNRQIENQIQNLVEKKESLQLPKLRNVIEN